VRLAEEHAEQLKIDADAYVTETLRNLREHLVSVETDVSRTILSIERGLDSLEEQQRAQLAAEDEESEEELENELPLMEPLPRRASLAADTMGGPNF
jgi:hypothetical protein